MNVLLLIPSYRKLGSGTAVVEDKHPVMDYDALAAGIQARGAFVRLYDYHALEADPDPYVKLLRKALPKDLALAAVGGLQALNYSVIYTNGENIGLPLALILKFLGKRRPGHVMIGHRLTSKKKRFYLDNLELWRQVDTILVYSQLQKERAMKDLDIPDARLVVIPFQADTKFWRPRPEVPVEERLVSAAGLEWRDYPTLLSAAERLPATQFRLAAASPWSKHQNETEKRPLPSNVEARPYNYAELRDLYNASGLVAVPLYENDFQAGVTSILEAMACGKVVIVSRTEGQTDVVVGGENGLYVPVGDPEAWEKLVRQVQEDPELRARIGTSARKWVEKNASLNRWVENVASAIFSCMRR